MVADKLGDSIEHARILKDCTETMTPTEQKWLIRIILKGRITSPILLNGTVLKMSLDGRPQDWVGRKDHFQRHASRCDGNVQYLF